MENLSPKITFDTFPPQCGANHGDRWLAEVRKDGWLADRKRFDTKEEAEAWGSTHSGELSKGVAQAYVNMIERWNNK